jgi:hypothetical protein
VPANSQHFFFVTTKKTHCLYLHILSNDFQISSGLDNATKGNTIPAYRPGRG